MLTNTHKTMAVAGVIAAGNGVSSVLAQEQALNLNALCERGAEGNEITSDFNHNAKLQLTPASNNPAGSVVEKSCQDWIAPSSLLANVNMAWFGAVQHGGDCTIAQNLYQDVFFLALSTEYKEPLPEVLTKFAQTCCTDKTTAWFVDATDCPGHGGIWPDLAGNQGGQPSPGVPDNNQESPSLGGSGNNQGGSPSLGGSDNNQGPPNSPPADGSPAEKNLDDFCDADGSFNDASTLELQFEKKSHTNTCKQWVTGAATKGAWEGALPGMDPNAKKCDVSQNAVGNGLKLIYGDDVLKKFGETCCSNKKGWFAQFPGCPGSKKAAPGFCKAPTDFKAEAKLHIGDFAQKMKLDFKGEEFKLKTELTCREWTNNMDQGFAFLREHSQKQCSKSKGLQVDVKVDVDVTNKLPKKGADGQNKGLGEQAVGSASDLVKEVKQTVDDAKKPLDELAKEYFKDPIVALARFGDVCCGGVDKAFFADYTNCKDVIIKVDVDDLDVESAGTKKLGGAALAVTTALAAAALVFAGF